MAATLSPFIPPAIFRSNLEHSEQQNQEGDFSYSYSELPVFRSRDANSRDGALQANPRPKSTCGVLNSNNNNNNIRSLERGRSKYYEDRNSYSLPFQDVTHLSNRQANSDFNNVKRKFELQTLCTNLPPKNYEDSAAWNHNLNKYSNGAKNVDRVRRKFEFQTTCTNLPPKFPVVAREENNSKNYFSCNNSPIAPEQTFLGYRTYDFKTSYNSLQLKPAKKRNPLNDSLFEPFQKSFETFQNGGRYSVDRRGNYPPKNTESSVAASKNRSNDNIGVNFIDNRGVKCHADAVFKSNINTNYNKDKLIQPKPVDHSAKNKEVKNNVEKKPAFPQHYSAEVVKGNENKNVIDKRHGKPVCYGALRDKNLSVEVPKHSNENAIDNSVFPPKSPSDDSVATLKNQKDFDGDKRNDENSLAWRFRNSIFSSLKLPRKESADKMASGRSTMAAQNHRLSCTLGREPRSASANTPASAKRKSAVELLAETKAFYVKSETVLDRKQELPLRMNNPLNSSSSTHYATLSGRHRRGGGEALQSQLRRLLGPTSTPIVATHDTRVQNVSFADSRTPKDNYEWEIPPHPSSTARAHYSSGTFSGNSSSGTSGSKGQVKSDPEQSRTSNLSAAYTPVFKSGLNRPSSSGDNRIFFPDSFVVPKPSRSDPANVFSNSFSIGSPFSSPEKIDARKILSVVDAYDTADYGKPDYYDDMVEDYSTISPPAEYAITERSNYRYGRSNSHSQASKGNPESGYVININSHKSLPDLHKQGEHYVEEGRRLSGASSGGGRYRESVGQVGDQQAIRSSEALSSYSRLTNSGRSNRSSVFSSKASDGHSRRSPSCHNSDRGSADEAYYYNRSGSSYARDSGGSSGPCSGLVGPPSLPPPTSRDSGSSTQHSLNRYSSYYDGYPDVPVDELAYHVSAPPQFQDGAPPQEPPPPPPGALQPAPRHPPVGIHFRASAPPVQFRDRASDNEGFVGRRESGLRESRHVLTHRPANSTYNQAMVRFSQEPELEASPPGLGNFKRQRCLRYKQRRPILRSKSDIAHRYWRDEKPQLAMADGSKSPPSSDNDSPERITRAQVDAFFDRLGMDEQTYRATILAGLRRQRRHKNKPDHTKLSPNPDKQNPASISPKKSYALDGGKPGTVLSSSSSDSLVFSEISVADSNLILANNGDYTVQGMTPKEPRLYRPCEPPSIVERNARIIKWLCNCRKLQGVI